MAQKFHEVKICQMGHTQKFYAQGFVYIGFIGTVLTGKIRNENFNVLRQVHQNYFLSTTNFYVKWYLTF